jgi:choline dehydrogenase-like flavoprotein
MSQHDFDAIVIGSGISGGWAAKELTEQGLKVLLLERGRSIIPSGNISVQRSSTCLLFEKKRCPPMSKQKPLYSTVRDIPPT